AQLDRRLTRIGGDRAAAHHDHASADREMLGNPVIGDLAQEAHRVDDLGEIVPGDGQNAALHHADAHEHGVVVLEQLRDLDVVVAGADVAVQPRIDPSGEDHVDFPPQLPV